MPVSQMRQEGSGGRGLAQLPSQWVVVTECTALPLPLPQAFPGQGF